MLLERGGWGWLLAAAFAPGRLCGWAQPRHPPLRLPLSPATAWGGSGEGQGDPRTQNPAVRGDGSAGGCLSPAWRRCAGWDGGPVTERPAGLCQAAAGAAAFSHQMPEPESMRDASASIRLTSRAGTRPFRVGGPSTLPPWRVADPRLRHVLGIPGGFFGAILSKYGHGLTQPGWHSVRGRRGHGHHVRTQRSLICMCCSPELRLQLPPPSIPLCNYCRRILVKYKLQTIQSLKELSISCCLLS